MVYMPTPWVVEHLQIDRTTTQYDDLGNEVKVFKPPVTRRVYGWAPPRAGLETQTVGVTTSVVDLVVYSPPLDYTIDTADRFRVNGKTYEVEGEPGDYSHGPFGFEGGVTINLRRAE